MLKHPEQIEALKKQATLWRELHEKELYEKTLSERSFYITDKGADRMKLWEQLMADINNTERKANAGGYWPPVNLKRAKCIKINPRVFHELASEEATDLKENKLLMPLIRHNDKSGDFAGIPFYIDQRTKKWEIII